MKKLVESFSRTKTLIFAASIFLLTMILVNSVVKPDFTYLTQTFQYTPTDVYHLLSRIGENGRKIHLLVFLADLLMVGCYSISLIGLNYKIFNRLSLKCGTFTFITFSPLLLSLIQLIEIVCLFILIINYPNQLTSLANLANIVTIGKTVLTPICFITPLIGLGLPLLRRRHVESE